MEISNAPLMSSFTQRCCLAACILAAMVSAPALAGSYGVCVTNATELQDALTAGSDNGMHSGDDIEIDVSAGTYRTGAATGGKAFNFTSTQTTGSLVIRGGFGPSCNGYTGNATLAKLDGNSTTQVLNIKSVNGGVGLTQFTVQNGSSSDNGGGLNINFNTTTGSTQETDVDYLIIKDNHSQAQGGGFAISSDGTANGSINVDSSIAIGNSATVNYGAGVIQNNAGGNTYVTHDTVYNNTTTQSTGTGGLFLDSVGTSIGFVVDSIFWNNTNIGLNLSGFNNYIDYCDYGKLAGDAPVENNGPLSLTPQFVDATNEDFHLAAGSPLIGASKSTVGLDLDPEYHAYAQHGDIGTFAETIFIGNFDDN